MPSASMSPEPEAIAPSSLGIEASTVTSLPPKPWWSKVHAQHAVADGGVDVVDDFVAGADADALGFTDVQADLDGAFGCRCG